MFFSDFKGNIGVYSLDDNQIIFKYNFYKKKFKKLKKEIKLIVKKDIIIAVDNFGYAYSINYKKNKIVWAKNFLIPFRSNLFSSSLETCSKVRSFAKRVGMNFPR